MKRKDENPKLSKPKPTNQNQPQFKYPDLHFLSLAVIVTYKKLVPKDCNSCLISSLGFFGLDWVFFCLGLIWGFCFFGGYLLFLLLFPSVDLFQPHLGEVGLIHLFYVNMFVYVFMIPEPQGEEAAQLRALIKVKL